MCSDIPCIKSYDYSSPSVAMPARSVNYIFGKDVQSAPRDLLVDRDKPTGNLPSVER